MLIRELPACACEEGGRGGSESLEKEARTWVLVAELTSLPCAVLSAPASCRTAGKACLDLPYFDQWLPHFPGDALQVPLSERWACGKWWVTASKVILLSRSLHPPCPGPASRRMHATCGVRLQEDSCPVTPGTELQDHDCTLVFAEQLSLVYLGEFSATG